MSALNLLQSLHLAHLSQPSSQRPVYRAIRKLGCRRIVEIGLGLGQRAERMIRLAARRAGQDEVHYTGIDMFEGRDARAPGVTLKRAHRQLMPLGAKIQLVPGDPFSALSRCANALTGTDLLLISQDQDAESIERAWFYVPRMLHERSLVLREHPAPGGKVTLEVVPHEEIQAKADELKTQRRAA